MDPDDVDALEINFDDAFSEQRPSTSRHSLATSSCRATGLQAGADIVQQHRAPFRPPSQQFPSLSQQQQPAPAPAWNPSSSVVSLGNGPRPPQQQISTQIREAQPQRIPGPAGVLQDAMARGLPLPDLGSAAGVAAAAAGLADACDAAVFDPDFCSGPWLAALDALDVPSFQEAGMVIRNNVRSVMQGPQPCKVDKLMALVVSMRLTGCSDGFAVLKDPTGSIGACVHRLVLHSDLALGPGAVVMLENVSLFSPGPRARYLCITLNNVSQVFPATEPAPSQLARLQQQPLPLLDERVPRAAAAAPAAAAISQRPAPSQPPAWQAAPSAVQRPSALAPSLTAAAAQSDSLTGCLHPGQRGRGPAGAWPLDPSQQGPFGTVSQQQQQQPLQQQGQQQTRMLSPLGASHTSTQPRFQDHFQAPLPLQQQQQQQPPSSSALPRGSQVDQLLPQQQQQTQQQQPQQLNRQPWGIQLQQQQQQPCMGPYAAAPAVASAAALANKAPEQAMANITNMQAPGMAGQHPTTAMAPEHGGGHHIARGCGGGGGSSSLTACSSQRSCGIDVSHLHAAAVRGGDVTAAERGYAAGPRPSQQQLGKRGHAAMDEAGAWDEGRDGGDRQQPLHGHAQQQRGAAGLPAAAPTPCANASAGEDDLSALMDGLDDDFGDFL